MTAVDGHNRGDHAPSVATTSLEFRPDLEGLRGLAVLAVVAYHVGLRRVGGGYVGVDVFFVLSGFLITSLLLAELRATGTIALRVFFARRAARLQPAAIATLVATLLVGAAHYPPSGVAAIAASVRDAALFATNVVLTSQSTDYFATGAAAAPLLHTWSLAVEEQFYAAWPWLVLLVAGRHARRGRLSAALAALAVVSLAACWWFTFAARPTAYYGTPFRAWEFAVGGIVAAAVPQSGRAAKLPERIAFAAGWAGLLLVVAAAVVLDVHSTFPGVVALWPAVGAALLTLPSPPSRRSAGALLAARPLRWFGRHSYAWYLWHWPLLAFGADMLPHARTPERALLAVCALALAVLTRAFVEEPVRRSALAAGHPGRTLAAAVGAIALVCGAAEVTRRAAVSVLDDPRHRLVAGAAKDLPTLYRDGCSPTLTESAVTVCEYGSAAARRTVAVFGDSHAAHWVPALSAVAGARGWKLIVVTKSACPSVDADVYEAALGRKYVECVAWRRAALDSIRARRPAFVWLANSSEYVFGDTDGDARASVTADDWERGLKRTLESLRDARVPVLVVQDVPHARTSVPLCLEKALWQNRPGGVCDFSLAGGVHEIAAAVTRRATARYPEDRVLDFGDALCPDARCRVERGHVVLYRDARHLTARGSLQLTRFVERAIEGAFPGAAPSAN